MQKNTHALSRSSAVHPHRCLRFLASMFLVLAWLSLSAAQAQTTNYALGTAALLVGPASGANSVVLAVTPATGAWTATPNASWMHLDAADQSGAGSTNVVFTFDANTGATRSGTITLGDQTLTVTQAGATYVQAGPVTWTQSASFYFAARPVTTLVSSGLSGPSGVAVDGSGNVYIADTTNNAIREWTAANNTVTTLVSSGLSYPSGVAVDGAGNVYIADTGNNAIKEWTAADSNVTTLVSSGLSGPRGVAVDSAGNLYIAVGYGIDKWTATNSFLTNLVSLNSSVALGVAVDVAGNLAISQITAIGELETVEWKALSGDLSMLLSDANVPLGSLDPIGVAVDGAGNVYSSDVNFRWISQWTAANKTVSTLVFSAPNQPLGIAADAAGNLYFSESLNNVVDELPYAFVDPSDRPESQTAGSDSLPMVLPATANLIGPFAPTSDQPWLTVTGVTNGIVSFSFSATTSNRTGYITVIGEPVPVTQGAPNYLLGTAALVEGPTAGSDSVVLAIFPTNGAWTATANDTWLHLNTANQSGTGTTNVVFTYDANTGATRSGTLTIGDQTLTVTQAGSTYVAIETVTTLASGLDGPAQIAVDGVGNVYIADVNAVAKWSAAENTVTALVSGLGLPTGVAVDGAGNVYFSSDSPPYPIYEWTAANSNVTTLVSSNVMNPVQLAMDGVGNLYFPNDYGTLAYRYGPVISEWTASDNNLSRLALPWPMSVAVDVAGNIYYATEFVLNIFPFGGSVPYGGLEEWVASGNTVVQLAAPGSNLYVEGGFPSVAVDGSGNVYMASFVIQEWSAANNTITILVPDVEGCLGVAVDSGGNVYFSESAAGVVDELPHAFVDLTPKLEGLAAGADSLPPVVPASENLLPPFAPTSDQSWLTITGITNGVVSFSFTANTGPARTANITLLGQTIPITQGTIGTPPILTSVQMRGGGILQFGCTNNQTASLTVLSTTDLSLPLGNWTVVGTATNTAPGQFQFTSQPTTNDAQRYYVVRSP